MSKEDIFNLIRFEMIHLLSKELDEWNLDDIDELNSGIMHLQSFLHMKLRDAE